MTDGDANEYSDFDISDSEEDTEFIFEDFSADHIMDISYAPGEGTAEILHMEEPDRVLDAGAIESLNGSKIRELRRLLAEWLFNVSFAYPSTTDTLFQCISLFDRFLAKRSVPFRELQLMCCCCFWICAKIDVYAEASLDPLLGFCHGKFSRAAFVRAEASILCAVDYRVHSATPYFFMKTFIGDGRSEAPVSVLSEILCECSLLFIDISRYRPSLIAFCATILAHGACAVDPGNIGNVARSFDKGDITQCAALVLRAGQCVIGKPTSAVHRKYATKTVDGVARAGASLITNADIGSGLVRAMNALSQM